MTEHGSSASHNRDSKLVQHRLDQLVEECRKIHGRIDKLQVEVQRVRTLIVGNGKEGLSVVVDRLKWRVESAERFITERKQWEGRMLSCMIGVLIAALSSTVVLVWIERPWEGKASRQARDAGTTQGIPGPPGF